MNEPTTAAPAPVSTADIARETVESFADRDTRETSTESPAAAAAEQPAASEPPSGNGNRPPTAEEISEAEALLRESGYATLYKPDGREHYIPRSKVLKMIDSGLVKRAGALEAARKEWEKERGTLAEQAAHAKQWRSLMEGPDPRALLARMAEADPRYRVFLEPPAAQPAKPADDDPEPGPDLDMGDGRMTYSLAGMKRVREWDKRQLERALEAKLQPLTRREQDAERKARELEHDRQLEERGAALIQRARTWPGWKEHEAEILKALQDDTADAQAAGRRPQLSVEEAYIRIVPAKMQAATRENVLKEVASAPKSTSVGKTGAEPVRAPATETTRQIAQRVLERSMQSGS